MRRNLEQCFEDEKLTPFPPAKRSVQKCREKHAFIHVYTAYVDSLKVMTLTWLRGVRHSASRRTRFRNPLDFTWISDFRLDFWISRGFLDFKVDFWISRGFPDFKVDFYILDFVGRASICYSEDTVHKQAFSAQMHTEYNVTGTSQFTATHCILRA